MPRLNKKARGRLAVDPALRDLAIEMLTVGRVEIHRGHPLELEQVLWQRDSVEIYDDICRRVWEHYGEPLTQRHIDVHPGKRPWGWWEYEAPELRQPIVHFGIDTPFEPRSVVPDFKRVSWMGMHTELWRHNPFQILHARTDSEVERFYESQADFLRRHGLLTPAEQAALSD